MQFPRGPGRRQEQTGEAAGTTTREVYYSRAAQLKGKNTDRNKHSLFTVQGNDRHETQQVIGSGKPAEVSSVEQPEGKGRNCGFSM